MKFLNFFKKRPVKVLEEHSESEYYENLFVKNTLWNTPKPNLEEVLRWEIIEEFVNISKKEWSKKDSKTYNILDLGCGRGWLTNLLSEYGNVKGIEPVETVIGHAKKMFPDIQFAVGTSKDLLLGDCTNSFHLIVSSEVIEHIPDDQKDDFVKDISKLLNDDGFVILTTPRKEAQREWHKYLSPDQPIEDWISESELELLLTKNSYKTLRKRRIAMTPPVANAPKIEIYQLWLFQKQ